MTKNEALLLTYGWKVDECGGWLDPTGNWPDPLTADEAAHVQWGRDFNAANGYTPPAVPRPPVQPPPDPKPASRTPRLPVLSNHETRGRI